MRALGNYLIRGRLQAIVTISFLTIFSLLLPALVYIISGVPVALVTLRRGAVIGLQVITGSVILTLVLAYLLNLTIPVVLAFASGIWLPTWCCAVILRKTESQGLLVLTAGLIGMIFILCMYILVGDVTAWWQEWLDNWLEHYFPGTAGEQYREIFATAVPLLNAMITSGVVISLIITTLIGRWWQALLFYPGQFRKEFYALRLPRQLIFPTLLGVMVLLIAQELQQSILRDLLVVIVFLYLFQGIATVHRLVNWKKLSSAWLVSMYALLFLLPQMALFVACIGMADSWMGKKDPDNGGNSPESG